MLGRSQRQRRRDTAGFADSTRQPLYARVQPRQTIPPSQQNDSSPASGATGHSFSQLAFSTPVQAKLTVNAPGDSFEREADQVADQVMRMAQPESALLGQGSPVRFRVQRCATCGGAEPEGELCPACAAAKNPPQSEPLAQRISPLAQRALHTPPAQTEGALSPSIAQRLEYGAHGGSPLPADIRSFMEPRIGADFSQVRVHTGSEAVQLSRELNAHAFTVGRDIYYGAGKAPARDALTAHELTHVVQQTGGLQRQADDEAAGCPLCEADEQVQRSVDISALSDSRLQRDDDEEESGGVLDWVSETASSAYDTASEAAGGAAEWVGEQAGSAYDAASEAAGSAYDTVSEAAGGAAEWVGEQAGGAYEAASEAAGSAYDTVSEAAGGAAEWVGEQAGGLADWAGEKAGAAADWVGEQAGAAADYVGEKAGAAADWVGEQASDASAALIAQQKASALSQISQLLPKFSAGIVNISPGQLASLNGQLAALSGASQGAISIGGISAEPVTDDEGNATEKKTVPASVIQGILQQLQAGLSAPMFSPEPAPSGEQGTVQRAAMAAPLVVAGGLAVMALKALAIIAVFLGILWLLSKAIELVTDKIKDIADAEAEKEKCRKTWEGYKALKCESCKGTDTDVERAAKIACITALIAGRQSWIDNNCDYIMDGSIKRGSAEAERGHKLQVEQELARLAKCKSLPTRK